MSRTPRTDALTDEQRDLAGRYFPYAMSLARGFWRRWESAKDDFCSAASLGLIEAARDFDPSLGVKFATYARRRIVGRCLDCAQALAKERRRPMVELCEAIACRPDKPTVESDELLHALLGLLPPRSRQRRVMTARYAHGMKGVEIARKMRRSPGRIGDCHTLALNQLRERLADELLRRRILGAG